MASFDRLSVYTTMLSTGLVPLFYHPDPKIACKVAEACCEGNAQVLELTSRGDGALCVFDELIRCMSQSHKSVILGIGSIIDEPTAALYIAHGANFIVSPGFFPAIARLCNRRKIAYIPGAMTVTEISAAEEAGAEIIKIFPAGSVGPSFIKDVMGPMPWVRLLPTGGIDAKKENIAEWIHAGAACLGMGSKLISKEAMASGDFSAIQKNVSTIINWIKEARKK
jgi:2-dehydro-3-deoxyphosphogluconate aldolase / (4S)-4-hydroxy-2-oxoglutarate aldolase